MKMKREETNIIFTEKVRNQRVSGGSEWPSGSVKKGFLKTTPMYDTVRTLPLRTAGRGRRYTVRYVRTLPLRTAGRDH